MGWQGRCVLLGVGRRCTVTRERSWPWMWTRRTRLWHQARPTRPCGCGTWRTTGARASSLATTVRTCLAAGWRDGIPLARLTAAGGIIGSQRAAVARVGAFGPVGGPVCVLWRRRRCCASMGRCVGRNGGALHRPYGRGQRHPCRRRLAGERIRGWDDPRVEPGDRSARTGHFAPWRRPRGCGAPARVCAVQVTLTMRGRSARLGGAGATADSTEPRRPARGNGEGGRGAPCSGLADGTIRTWDGALVRLRGWPGAVRGCS